MELFRKIEYSCKVIKAGHRQEKTKFSGRATTNLEGKFENCGLEGGETKTQGLKMHCICPLILSASVLHNFVTHKLNKVTITLTSTNPNY